MKEFTEKSISELDEICEYGFERIKSDFARACSAIMPESSSRLEIKVEKSKFASAPVHIACVWYHTINGCNTHYTRYGSLIVPDIDGEIDDSDIITRADHIAFTLIEFLLDSVDNFRTYGEEYYDFEDDDFGLIWHM